MTGSSENWTTEWRLLRVLTAPVIEDWVAALPTTTKNVTSAKPLSVPRACSVSQSGAPCPGTDYNKNIVTVRISTLSCPSRPPLGHFCPPRYASFGWQKTLRLGRRQRVKIAWSSSPLISMSANAHVDGERTLNLNAVGGRTHHAAVLLVVDPQRVTLTGARADGGRHELAGEHPR